MDDDVIFDSLLIFDSFYDDYGTACTNWSSCLISLFSVLFLVSPVSYLA
jgi:hypothetical protein